MEEVPLAHTLLVFHSPYHLSRCCCCLLLILQPTLRLLSTATLPFPDQQLFPLSESDL